MKGKQSSIDFYSFISLYRDQIRDCFIKKIYQVSQKEFYVQIYRSDLKRRGLLISLERGIAFHEPLLPEQASPLATTLRRMLSERKIMNIEQINFDRVVRIQLATGQELILELFREGNLIITNGGKIEWAMAQREWKNRKIIKGEPYVPPVANNPLTMGSDEVQDMLANSKASIVQTLATRMNLGGETSEEIVRRAGLNKDSPSSENSENSSLILDQFRALLSESSAGKAYYYEEEKIVSPVELTHLNRPPSKVFDDLNDGFSFYFGQFPYSLEPEDPMERRIRSQEKSIEEFQRISAEYREKGTMVLSNLKEVSNFIRKISSTRRVDPSTNYSPFSEISINQDRKTVSAMFQGMVLDLRYDMTAGANADNFFATSKQYRDKIAHAKVALDNSRNSISTDTKKVVKKRRRHWFETYRWFYTSEGLLVIAGKDRKTNESVVKKHMSSGDLYIHADLYGAPSTVLKAEPDLKPGEASIKEACNFSVAMSRAWPAETASGSAYWVHPEQVSKTAESGEYVSHGSWIVRGKRNYLFDLPMKLEISPVEINGDRIPMIAPVSESVKNGPVITISPGGEKRTVISKKIAKTLGVDQEEIDPILPPGNSSITGIRGQAQETVSAS